MKVPTNNSTETAVMLWVGLTGQSNSWSSSVEVYFFETNTSCQWPDLPDTQGNGQAIGNLYCNQRGCLKFSLDPGAWIRTNHTLPTSQSVSASWKIDEDIYIFGSHDDDLNFRSTLLKPDGSVDTGFSLKYGAW